MIKAIVFDCFGVLVTEKWFSFKDKYFGDDDAKAKRAAELMDQANVGVITREQFVQELGELANTSPDTVRGYLEGNAPNLQLLRYIEKELAPKYSIGMLSNASSSWLRQTLDTKQLDLFDVIDLSYESGIAKPQELAYANIASKLGALPEECVFVDDQERHCTGARDAGMVALQYQNFSTLVARLTELLETPRT